MRYSYSEENIKALFIVVIILIPSSIMVALVGMLIPSMLWLFRIAFILVGGALARLGYSYLKYLTGIIGVDIIVDREAQSLSCYNERFGEIELIISDYSVIKITESKHRIHNIVFLKSEDMDDYEKADMINLLGYSEWCCDHLIELIKEIHPEIIVKRVGLEG